MYYFLKFSKLLCLVRWTLLILLYRLLTSLLARKVVSPDTPNSPFFGGHATSPSSTPWEAGHRYKENPWDSLFHLPMSFPQPRKISWVWEGSSTLLTISSPMPRIPPLEFKSQKGLCILLSILPGSIYLWANKHPTKLPAWIERRKMEKW